MARHMKEVGSVSYISTDSFHTNFYTYTITSSPSPVFIKVGSLVPVAGATSANCPAGNILRENGKKLYPGAHSGVTTYMVGVFDIVSGLKGYINPNDPMFAPYNSERPLYQPDSVYTTDGTTKNLGPSVLTLGYIAASEDVTTAGQVRSSSFTELEIVDGIGGAMNTAILDVSKGQVFMISITKSVTIIPTNMSTGSVVYLIIQGGNSQRPLSFGGGIQSRGNFDVGVGETYTIHFVCGGPTGMFELGRTGALTG
jgi:hypothetical protein